MSPLTTPLHADTPAQATHKAVHSQTSILRDFTLDGRVWLLSSVAILIGLSATLLAVLLLRLIALATNLFYFARWSTADVAPVDAHLGPWRVILPVIGGLLVGLLARFGSEKIRGHGIPEAIEAILLHRAKVQPKIAILKPLSASIAIGSGGPFGAEGPIIVSGGAVGSLIAQWLKVTDAERTTLLVCGAAAGMTAIFNSPLAAILLAVELLLFELRPRSLVPVALAAATAALFRILFLGSGPIFNMPAIGDVHTLPVAAGALLLGGLLGLLSAGLSKLLYGFEDMFEHLPIHWMWWPILGGLGIGVGGLIFPRGLGVGYGNIRAMLAGDAGLDLILGILLVKSLMWTFSLGSGTSGGVLAPLLMIGGAGGALGANLLHLPAPMQALWALIGMGAMLSGALGVPLTGIVFALEVTGCFPALLPLTIACIAAYLVTALIMPRSILTEKLSRRGYHLTREYGVDPLETVMIASMVHSLGAEPEEPETEPTIFVYADSTARNAVEIMAAAERETIPVVDRATGAVTGTLSLLDLLHGRSLSIRRERERERLLRRHAKKA